MFTSTTPTIHADDPTLTHSACAHSGPVDARGHTQSGRVWCSCSLRRYAVALAFVVSIFRLHGGTRRVAEHANFHAPRKAHLYHSYVFPKVCLQVRHFFCCCFSTGRTHSTNAELSFSITLSLCFQLAVCSQTARGKTCSREAPAPTRAVHDVINLLAIYTLAAEGHPHGTKWLQGATCKSCGECAPASSERRTTW